MAAPARSPIPSAFHALARRALASIARKPRAEKPPAPEDLAAVGTCVLMAMDSDAEGASRVLFGAFDRWGEPLIRAALSQPLWKTMGLPSHPHPKPLGGSPLVEQWIAPAEAVLTIRDKAWRDRLAGLLPEKAWASQIPPSRALRWCDRHDHPGAKENFKPPPATPLLRLSGQCGSMSEDQWRDAFALARTMCPAPDSAQTAAALYDVAKMAPSYRDAIFVWAESRALRDALIDTLPDPSAPRPRSKSL